MMVNKPITGWKGMKDRRYELRNNMTGAESLLWESLRKKKLGDVRFRRQHGIGPYVVDFYHALTMTVIEIDGSIHDEREAMENDRWRESYLTEHGYKVIRFRNEEIFTDLDSVLGKILKSIRPAPL